MSEESRQAKLIVSVEQRGADATATSLRGVTQAGAGAEASFGNLALKIAGYTSAANLAVSVGTRAVGMVKDLARESVVLAASFEKSRVTWGVLVGDMAKGERVFEEIRSFAAKTPLSFEALNQAATTVKGFGAANEEIIPILSKLGDIALGDNAKLQSLSLVYGQVMAQGKAKTQDLYQFINAGVPIFNLLATSMNRSAGEIKELAAEGAVTFEEIEKAITQATSAGGQFYDMMNKTAETTAGKWSTAVDNFKATLADLGGVVLPAVNLALDEYNRRAEKQSNRKNAIAALTSNGREGDAAAALAYLRLEQSRGLMADFVWTDIEVKIRRLEAINQQLIESAARQRDAAGMKAAGVSGLSGGTLVLPPKPSPVLPLSDDYLTEVLLALNAPRTTSSLGLTSFGMQAGGRGTHTVTSSPTVTPETWVGDDWVEKWRKQTEAAEKYNQTLDQMRNLMGTVGIEAWVSGWQSVGAAIYDADSGMEAIAGAFSNLGNMILSQLPQLMFMAGFQAIMKGQFWLGMSWILASGVVGAAGGYAEAATQDNALGGVYASPSLHSYVNGVYDSPRLFNFARGAAMGRFGEAGPEAIMPLQPDSQGRLGVSGVASKTNVTINNYASNTQATVSEQENPDGSHELVVAVENVVKSGMANGRYRAYGVRQQPRRG